MRDGKALAPDRRFVDTLGARDPHHRWILTCPTQSALVTLFVTSRFVTSSFSKELDVLAGVAHGKGDAGRIKSPSKLPQFR